MHCQLMFLLFVYTINIDQIFFLLFFLSRVTVTTDGYRWFQKDDKFVAPGGKQWVEREYGRMESLRMAVVETGQVKK